eukprot:64641-Chlamydomonas_euryale.AAC.3
MASCGKDDGGSAGSEDGSEVGGEDTRGMHVIWMRCKAGVLCRCGVRRRCGVRCRCRCGVWGDVWEGGAGCG